MASPGAARACAAGRTNRAAPIKAAIAKARMFVTPHPWDHLQPRCFGCRAILIAVEYQQI
jgi:hypothetical protein